MRRRPIVISAVAAMALLIAIVVAGLSHVFVRSYSLDIANRLVVATVGPHQRVCEGAIPATGGAFTQAQVFGASVQPGSQGVIRVLTDPGDRLLGSGSFRATPVGAAYTATFNHPISDTKPLRVCVAERVNSFVLQGNPQATRSLKIGDGKSGNLFSLSLGNQRSTFAALPTSFDRAASLKPSWVGGWTFWILAAALLACLALGAFAVARAAAEDEDADTS